MQQKTKKLKYCEVGEHEVPSLWRAKRGDTVKACCKYCLHKGEPAKETKSDTRKAQDATIEAQKKALNVFFANQALLIPKNCENCSQRLILSNDFDRRCVIAHILPKSITNGFPSVAIHPQNKMFLGTKCGCHSKWDDKGAEDRKKMAVYSLAIERFRKFEEHLTPKELIKAYKYLNLE